MERLNLNVPESVRADLRRIAKRRGLREAEAARELLLQAIEDAERAEFARAMQESMTPALKERLARVADAIERIDE
jgi:hypothetical protein